MAPIAIPRRRWFDVYSCIYGCHDISAVCVDQADTHFFLANFHTAELEADYGKEMPVSCGSFCCIDGIDAYTQSV